MAKDLEIAIHDGDLKRLHNPDTFRKEVFPNPKSKTKVVA